VFAIPPAMRAMLRTQVINRSYSREQRLQALVEMIFDRHGLDLQYDADATSPSARSGSSAAPTAWPSP
jgi:hypothetical protein